MKISEMIATLPEFMSEINRVIRENNIYGATVVLFREDGECHSYAFELQEGDFDIAGNLMTDYKLLMTEAN